MIALALLLIVEPNARAARPFALTIDNIMRGTELVGEPPRRIRWSPDGKVLSFLWKSPGGRQAQNYQVNADGTHMVPAEDPSGALDGAIPSADGRLVATVVGGTVVVRDHDGARRVSGVAERRLGLAWTADARALEFTSGGTEKLLALDTGEETVMCTVSPGQVSGPGRSLATGEPTAGVDTPSRKVLAAEEAKLFPDAGARRGFAGFRRPGQFPGRGPQGAAPVIKLKENQRAFGFEPSPDGIHTAVPIVETTGSSRTTEVPNYITASGYTEDIPSYPKVGDVHRESTLAIADKGGKVAWLTPPAAVNGRPYSVRRSLWSADGKMLVASVDTEDHKDRYIVRVDPDTGASTVLFTDHSDAWLGGPGANVLGWLPDSRHFYFESERDGWAHLYTVDAVQGGVKQVTSGKFEVSDVHLSRDGKRFYFVSSEGSPFRRHLDDVDVDGGARTRLLPPGRNDTLDGDSPVYLSPDDGHVAYLHSWENHPPELYVAPLAPGSSEIKLTESPSPEWLSYPWTKPPIVDIPASDGVRVPAHFYKPAHFARGGPAVIFVHGAGYLQNVHDWWSSTYYREYMFNHLLMAHGVAVLDIDYRASAGYGRDWRTAIYRFMGGRDLDDQVDGARWLVKTQGVDPKRIGIYGGSYGGFLTLMAMFTKPGVFAAGAALRPVSDWANYNDGYTSDILNLPQDDPVAYRRSSPIFHAEGLVGALLICHGVVDTNVHYQDTVRLVQRLIDLHKENWSVAFYPMESHEFTHDSSWADEYKRVFKLLRDNLKF